MKKNSRSSSSVNSSSVSCCSGSSSSVNTSSTYESDPIIVKVELIKSITNQGVTFEKGYVFEEAISYGDGIVYIPEGFRSSFPLNKNQYKILSVMENSSEKAEILASQFGCGCIKKS